MIKVKSISASKAFPTVGYMHTWIRMTILMINTIMKIIIVDVFVNILFVNKRSKKVTHTHLSLNRRSQLLSWLGTLQKPLLLPFYNRGYVERSLGKNICLWKNQLKKKEIVLFSYMYFNWFIRNFRKVDPFSDFF